MKKLKDIYVTEKEKCKDYFLSICGLWGVVLVVIIMCFIGGISLKDIGFRQISFNHGLWFNAIVFSLSGLFFAFCLYNLISSLISSKFRETQAKQLVNGEEKYFHEVLKKNGCFPLWR
jgi:hypothetical protein